MAHLPTGSGSFLLAALALAAVPAVALAEDGPPPREGNIWGWRDHEPTQSEVHRDEQAAGVAPSPGQQRHADDDVKSIYRQLMGNERRDGQ